MNCAKPLLPLGIISDGVFLQSAPKPTSAGSTLFAANSEYLKGMTSFPFGLMISQHITESAFAKVLQNRGEKDQSSEVPFLRGMKMVDMKENERETSEGRKKGFLTTFDNGRSIWCRYLVGADGGKSTVSNTGIYTKLSLLRLRFSGPHTSADSL
jgi:2-polyprenyl-6-methoxyphenol hydroxylase-like FAD-dependent oxidoreductase